MLLSSIILKIEFGGKMMMKMDLRVEIVKKKNNSFVVFINSFRNYISIEDFSLLIFF